MDTEYAISKSKSIVTDINFQIRLYIILFHFIKIQLN